MGETERRGSKRRSREEEGRKGQEEETEKVLQSMPPGVNMDMGKGYDDNDWLRRSSISQRLM